MPLVVPRMRKGKKQGEKQKKVKAKNKGKHLKLFSSGYI